MSLLRVIRVASIVVGGCGFSSSIVSGDGGSNPDPDAPSIPGDENFPPIDGPLPTGTLTPGGGITGGAIAGVVDVYVIDELTGVAIANATVTVGASSGTTDANGLFIAHAASITGKQTVLAAMTSYRTEMWVGVTGSSVTIPLRPTPLAPPPSGTITATITDFATPAPPPNHYRFGFATYSQSDLAYPGGNELAQNGNTCFGATCTVTVTSRTGTVAFAAAIYDVDQHGVGMQDDTFAVQTYAIATGVAVGSATTTNLNLTKLPDTALNDATLALGSPPSVLSRVQGFIAIDVPIEGSIYLPAVVGSGIKIPKLVNYVGSSYRATGVANTGGNLPESTLVHRGNIGTTLDLGGTWLGVPSAVTATTSAIAWTAPAGTTITRARFAGVAGDVLEVVTFDATASVNLPAALVTSGMKGTVQAVRGTFDPTSFGFVTDVAKFDAHATVTFTVP